MQNLKNRLEQTSASLSMLINIAQSLSISYRLSDASGKMEFTLVAQDKVFKHEEEKRLPVNRKLINK